MKKRQRYQKRAAFTLVECTLASIVLVIVIAAVMRYRTYAAASAQRAESQLLAARCACFLSEAWKGRQGDLLFDPELYQFDSGFTIEKINSAALLTSEPTDSWTHKLHTDRDVTPTGIYRISVDNRDYVAELLYGPHPDVDNLRCLHVLLVWEDFDSQRYEYYLPALTQS